MSVGAKNRFIDVKSNGRIGGGLRGEGRKERGWKGTKVIAGSEKLCSKCHSIEGDVKQ